MLLMHLARKHPHITSGGLLFILIAILGLLAPILAPANPTKIALVDENRQPGWTDGNGMVHILGTDHLGRDLFSRILFAIRLSLFVGVIAMFIGALIGGFLGLTSGYFGGMLDDTIMRIVDIWMSFPYILLAIVFAAFWGTGLGQVIIIVGIRGWVDYTRIIRGSVLSIKNREFIEAARAIGVKNPRIVIRHVLPNVIGPTVVLATFQVGASIMLEATLSFLGLGISPPTPSLGGILNDGRRYIAEAWWPVVSSGVILILIVLAINQLGDGLRDLLDPRRQ